MELERDPDQLLIPEDLTADEPLCAQRLPYIHLAPPLKRLDQLGAVEPAHRLSRQDLIAVTDLVRKLAQDSPLRAV